MNAVAQEFRSPIEDLAARIAAQVLGWREVRKAGDQLIGIPPTGLVDPADFLAGDVALVPPYPRSMEDARPLVSLFEARGWSFDLTQLTGGAWKATFYRETLRGERKHMGFDASQAVATCRAACRAVGIEP